jgi:type I restriction enzyme S subunit
MVVFRPLLERGDPRFVSWLFQSDSYRDQLSVVLAGSSINNLTPTSVKSLSFSVPVEAAEQTAIAEVLSDMDADLAAYEARAAKARAIKQGMMQELLTGKVRLL